MADTPTEGSGGSAAKPKTRSRTSPKLKAEAPVVQPDTEPAKTPRRKTAVPPATEPVGAEIATPTATRRGGASKAGPKVAGSKAEAAGKSDRPAKRVAAPKQSGASKVEAKPGGKDTAPRARRTPKAASAPEAPAASVASKAAALPQMSAKQVAAGAGIFAALVAGIATLFGRRRKGKAQKSGD